MDTKVKQDVYLYPGKIRHTVIKSTGTQITIKIAGVKTRFWRKASKNQYSATAHGEGQEVGGDRTIKDAESVDRLEAWQYLGDAWDTLLRATRNKDARTIQGAAQRLETLAAEVSLE